MRRTVLIGAALALASVMALSLVGRRWRAATGEVDGAQGRLAALVDDARVVSRLRQGAATASEGERPTADVIALVNRVLAQAGIPTTRFAGCAPEGDSSVAGQPSLRRQAVRLTLQGLTSADLGSFLEAWRADANPWTPVTLEMNHGPDAGSPTYDTQIVLAAMYHAPPDGKPR